jgi:hypothetical protein
MNRETSVGDLLSQLKREIADRQRMVDEIATRLVDEPKPRRGGYTAAAVEVLRAAGRPMHALREVIPAIEAKGFAIGTRAGFATALLRTGKIVRTAPGTFAYQANTTADDAAQS